MKNHVKKELPVEAIAKKPELKDLPFEDDRYPGSFFKVPGVPRPGKTSWRIS